VQRYAEFLTALSTSRPPSLVWAATPYLNALAALPTARALDVPLVYDVRGFPDLTLAAERPTARNALEHAVRRAETRCMREADLVLTLSETMQREIVRRGVDEERVRVIPHAVDVPLASDSEVVERLRDSLGLRDKLIAGHASTLRDYEGADVLLEALAMAPKARDELVCLIVGDGPARTNLERLARDLDVKDRVVFTGRVPSHEMRAYYELCDLFVVPRKDHEVCRRVTPLKLVEAMAAGRCLVVSSLPALTEAGDGCARSVPPGDPAELSRALHELAEDPQERARLEECARERAACQYSQERLDAALRSVMETLVS
jgi:glycosyltransferase involved in cell wall biosynthesis